MLIERGDFERRAEPHRAGIRRQHSRQHADQRGLAAAVRPDDADAVAALDADREIADDRAVAIALADPFGLDDQRAGRRRRTGGDGGIAGAGAIGAALFPQRLQLSDPAHVAFAPAGDAVAHPVLLGDDPAIELVLIAFLLRQHRVAPFLEMSEAALEAPRQPTVEPNRETRQRRKEAPVVADKHHRGAAGIEIALQPFDGRQIEMIGRLVEKQNIGRRREHARQRGAARLAAGEMRRIFVPGEAELFEENPRRMGIVVRPQPGLDISQRRREALEIRLLRQVAHQGSWLHENRAAIRLDEPGRDLQQRRFARAVAPDQRHALTGRNGQFRTREKRGPAECQCDVFELKKWRSHSPCKTVFFAPARSVMPRQ